jgi:hypothetical protein
LAFILPQAIKGYQKTTAQGKENAKEVNGPPRIFLRKQYMSVDKILK